MSIEIRLISVLPDVISLFVFYREEVVIEDSTVATWTQDLEVNYRPLLFSSNPLSNYFFSFLASSTLKEEWFIKTKNKYRTDRSTVIQSKAFTPCACLF